MEAHDDAGLGFVLSRMLFVSARGVRAVVAVLMIGEDDADEGEGDELGESGADADDAGEDDSP